MSDVTSEAQPIPLSLDGIDEIDFGADGLVLAVIQDIHTREVLMPGFTNKEMLRKTLETGNAWFWSRSQKAPWLKGETSGNFIRVREVRRNCYDNSLLYLSEPVGPACHTGAVSCFYRRLDGTDVGVPGSYDQKVIEPSDKPGSVEWLWEVIQQRVRDRPEGSYPVKLLDQGTDRVAKKVGEEAAEVIIAAKNRSSEELANEMADLWFHSLLLLQDAGMRPADVFQALASRHRSGSGAR